MCIIRLVQIDYNLSPDFSEQGLRHAIRNPNFTHIHVYPFPDKSSCSPNLVIPRIKLYAAAVVALLHLTRPPATYTPFFQPSHRTSKISNTKSTGASSDIRVQAQSEKAKVMTSVKPRRQSKSSGHRTSSAKLSVPLSIFCHVVIRRQLTIFGVIGGIYSLILPRGGRM